MTASKIFCGVLKSCLHAQPPVEIHVLIYGVKYTEETALYTL